MSRKKEERQDRRDVINSGDELLKKRPRTFRERFGEFARDVKKLLFGT